MLKSTETKNEKMLVFVLYKSSNRNQAKGPELFKHLGRMKMKQRAAADKSWIKYPFVFSLQTSSQQLGTLCSELLKCWRLIWFCTFYRQKKICLRNKSWNIKELKSFWLVSLIDKRGTFKIHIYQRDETGQHSLCMQRGNGLFLLFRC